MAKKILTVKYFNGGVGDSDKEGIRGSFYLSRNLDIFSEPTNITLHPLTAKISGSTVVGLPKWFVSGSPYNTLLYTYDSLGYIYSRTTGNTWTNLRKVASSSGQGMELFDDYIYYVQNTQIGRYGPLAAGSPTFTDNWQTGLVDTSATGKQLAPIKAFQAGFAVGHGNKLAWYDGAVWTLAYMTFPPGYNVRTLDTVDEFLAIGVWKGSTITDSETGIVFFWDGTSSTYNFFVEIPEGGINAILNSRNRLLSVVGPNGVIYLNYTPFQKVHKIPYLEYSKTLEIYPGAVTNWNGLSLIGVSGSTDSTTLTQGVYQWGAKSDKYNETLTLGFTPSHGKTQGTNLHIGALKGIGDELFIGWQDTTTTTLTDVVFDNPSADVVRGTKAAHGLSTGTIIVVSGCTQAYANATWTITVVNSSTFTLDSASWASFNGADVTGDAAIANTYGVDRVITTANPFATGVYESLIFDDNRPLQPKLAITLKATHKALVSGESVQLGYKKDRASSYTTGTANSTVGTTETRLSIPPADSRFYEFQFEAILATSGSTAPTITSIGLEYDDLSAETLL